MTDIIGAPLHGALRAAAVLLGCGLVVLPANAQRAPDDTRPGGVELKPSPPPAPAAATTAPSPSQLFSKPAVSPPVLPPPAAVPVQATPPAAPVPPAASPAKPATSPAAPAGTTPAKPGAIPGTGGPAAGPALNAPAADKPAATVKTLPIEPIDKTIRGPAEERRTRSLRAAPPAAGSAPPAGAASETPVPPSNPIKGNDRLPGGVERAPGVR